MLNQMFQTITAVSTPTTPLPRRIWMMVVVWMLAMISLPIFKWTIGVQVLSQVLTLAVVLQATAVLFILLRRWSWQRTLYAFSVITVFTLLIEIIGSHTGFPFGDYHYTALLTPQVGEVPLLIPAAWFMMLPPAWAVAHRFAHNRWLFTAVSAAALTAWDLMLDPQMVAWNLWVWDQPGGYFGIPWQNYLGWLGTAVLLTLIIRPDNLPRRSLIIIYTITWFLETVGLLFFWDLAGPAIVGGLVMGAFVLLGWTSVLRNFPLQPPPKPLLRRDPRSPIETTTD